MPFSLIRFILAATLMLAGVNVFLSYKLRRNSVFYRFLIYFNGYVLFHQFYIIIADEFFGDRLLFADPFSLLYGPLLYFTGISMTETIIRRKTILLHSLPVLGFLCVFLYLAWFTYFPESVLLYKRVLHFYMVLSNIIYIYISLKLSSEFTKGALSRARKFLFTGFLFLFIYVSVIKFLVTFSLSFSGIFSGMLSGSRHTFDPVSVNLLRALVYMALMVGAALVFRYLMAGISYKLYLYRQTKPAVTEKLPMEKAIKQASTKYERFQLTNVQLQDYAGMLHDLMAEREPPYLDTELSLHKLANLLRIPPHHLTQVFSLYIKQNFYDYINGYRTRYACNLLKKEKNKHLNLEELAMLSGFNSRVSFNRNFKNITGYTPSRYREKQGVLK